jgi:uncharacterized membrane protein YqjE
MLFAAKYKKDGVVVYSLWGLTLCPSLLLALEFLIIKNMYQKSRLKSFIGGTVIGLILGTVIGCIAMLLIMGTVFINANL